MLPILPPGRRVLLETVRAGRLRPGDVVALNGPAGGMIVHRLVGRDRTGRLLTRGDNAIRLDPPSRPECLIGRVIGVETAAGEWRRPRRTLLSLHASVARLPIARVRRLLFRCLAPFACRRAHPDEFPLPGSLSPLAPSPPPSPIQEGHDLEYQRLGNEILVLAPGTGDVHVVNALAWQIRTWAREGKTESAMIDRLESRYPDIGRAQLTDDLRGALDHLRRLGLVEDRC